MFGMWLVYGYDMVRMKVGEWQHGYDMVRICLEYVQDTFKNVESSLKYVCRESVWFFFWFDSKKTVQANQWDDDPK